MVIVYFTIHWFVWVYGVKGDLWEHYIPNNQRIFLFLYFFKYFFTTVIIDNNNYLIIFHLTLHQLYPCKWCWQSVSRNIYILISDNSILTSYAKVVQNRWRVGWVEISKSLAAEVRCFWLHVTEWSLLIQTGSYVDKLWNLIGPFFPDT